MNHTFTTSDGTKWIFTFHYCHEFPYPVWVKGESGKRTRLIVLGRRLEWHR